MAAENLFGWSFKKHEDKEEEKQKQLEFSSSVDDDGSVVVAAGGAYGQYIDLDSAAKSEAELVTSYRQMTNHAEVTLAIDAICNEAIVNDQENPIVKLVLDDIKELKDETKNKIYEEFDNVLTLLNFSNFGYDIFQKWYVDGRLYYHSIINPDKPDEGLKELRYIDPRKIRKIREVEEERSKKDPKVAMKKVKNEYFVYSEKGFSANTHAMEVGTDTVSGVKIPVDSIVHCTSGNLNETNSLVLSNLHTAIKPLNQLKMLEDAVVIYRVSRAPERRVFYIHVGNMPKAKAEQYVRDMMVRHKNKLVYNAADGKINDDRRVMCYALDTKIPLLDGRTLTIDELIGEYNEGKNNWVYSCDPVTGKFYPGPVSWAGITRKNSNAVKITLDNGKTITCTPDHKFPVWNKGFVEAQNLSIGESMIPGYRRFKPIMSNGVEYEQIYKNDTKKWEFTHREVSNWKNDLNIREEFVYNPKYTNKSKTTIHHADFNRLNNNPENLVIMNNRDHTLYHHDIQSIQYTDEIFEEVKNCAISLVMKTADVVNTVNSKIDVDHWKEINKDRNPKNRDVENLVFTYKDLKRIYKACGYNTWSAYYKAYDNRPRDIRGRVLKEGSSKKYSEEWINKLTVARRKRKKEPCKTWKITTPNGGHEIIENLNEYCRNNNLNRGNIKKDYGSRGYHAEILNNHKVVSVEFLDEKMTMGALTIDQNETYHSHHTYLLDAGIYTKNSMQEDFWLPRREDGKGTEITTLPSGQNLGEMEDVEYFKKKLYKSLKVPISRLEPETGFTLGRASEITRDEVNFAKFIDRLRNRFSILFDEILRRQLLLKNIISEKKWKEIQNQIRYDFNVDNHFAELKHSEIIQNRVSILREMDDYIGTYFSKKYVRNHILYQNDEEIDQMKKEIEEEKKEEPDEGDLDLEQDNSINKQ